MIKIRRRKLFEDDTQQQTQPQQQQLGGQQPVQVQQGQQQAGQPNETQQKAAEIMNNMKNSYWLMANNIPEEIQKVFPDFKQGNQKADPVIKLWNDFKAKPEENTFNAFVDGFKNYVEQPTEGNQNQQGQQPVQQGQQQPAQQ